MDQLPIRPDPAATTRGPVEDAVIRLVAQRGIAGVTIEDVAAAAGVAPASLPRDEDGSIAPLVLAAYDGILADLLDRCVTAYGAGPWSQGVRRGVGALFAAVLEDPVAARFAYLEVPAGGPATLDARALKRADWTLDFLAACATDSSELPSSTQIELFFGAVRQTVEDHLRRHALARLPNAIEPLVATFEPPPAAQPDSPLTA